MVKQENERAASSASLQKKFNYSSEQVATICNNYLDIVTYTYGYSKGRYIEKLLLDDITSSGEVAAYYFKQLLVNRSSMNTILASILERLVEIEDDPSIARDAVALLLSQLRTYAPTVVSLEEQEQNEFSIAGMEMYLSRLVALIGEDGHTALSSSIKGCWAEYKGYGRVEPLFLIVQVMFDNWSKFGWYKESLRFLEGLVKMLKAWEVPMERVLSLKTDIAEAVWALEPPVRHYLPGSDGAGLLSRYEMAGKSFSLIPISWNIINPAQAKESLGVAIARLTTEDGLQRMFAYFLPANTEDALEHAKCSIKSWISSHGSFTKDPDPYIEFRLIGVDDAFRLGESGWKKPGLYIWSGMNNTETLSSAYATRLAMLGGAEETNGNQYFSGLMRSLEGVHVDALKKRV